MSSNDEEPAFWHGVCNIYLLDRERLESMNFLVDVVHPRHIMKVLSTGASKVQKFCYFCEQGLLNGVKACHENKYIDLEQCADQAFMASVTWGQLEVIKWLYEMYPETIKPKLVEGLMEAKRDHNDIEKWIQETINKLLITKQIIIEPVIAEPVKNKAIKKYRWC